MAIWHADPQTYMVSAERIQMNYVFLMEHVDVSDDLTIRLYASRLLSECDLDDLRERPSGHRKLEYVLDEMMRKSREQFEKFVRILHETGQEHIATVLIRTPDPNGLSASSVVAAVLFVSDKF
jgi:hypothetical protein